MHDKRYIDRNFALLKESFMLIDVMKEETRHKPSRVSSRRISTNNVVSVKRYCNAEFMMRDTFQWSHNGILIEESETEKLLKEGVI